MDMIATNGADEDFDLFLLGEKAKDFSELLTDLSVEDLLSMLGDENKMVATIPFVWASEEKSCSIRVKRKEKKVV
jgi:hypothetical protein